MIDLDMIFSAFDLEIGQDLFGHAEEIVKRIGRAVNDFSWTEDEVLDRRLLFCQQVID